MNETNLEIEAVCFHLEKGNQVSVYEIESDLATWWKFFDPIIL
jgi:hypothetical protein